MSSTDSLHDEGKIDEGRHVTICKTIVEKMLILRVLVDLVEESQSGKFTGHGHKKLTANYIVVAQQIITLLFICYMLQSLVTVFERSNDKLT